MRNPAQHLLEDTAAYIRRVAYEEAKKNGADEKEASRIAAKAEEEFWKRHK